MKLLPNPNVLLELGYATAKIGWDRVVLVMNEAYGRPEQLMFDLKHRRFPIVYKMNTERRRDGDAIRQKLSNDIEEAIRAAIRAEHQAVADAIAHISAHCIICMRYCGKVDYFHPPERLTAGDILGHQQRDAALIRLIDLKMLKCDVAAEGQLYAYHWTYLGKLVSHHMKLRSSTGNGSTDAYTIVTHTN
jgi:hypothetical protein